MNYAAGAHSCNPIGEIKYSSKIYINKHMNCLGLPYYINKMINCYNRSENLRKNGLGTHYSENVINITNKYNFLLSNSNELIK